ncbi:hypothetical protein SAMN05720467_0529 [Fibrobacter sp. UWB7]|nr:hypothetical protein SAMN05720467_0529 [Fibrobacter sp. UWB7]
MSISMEKYQLLKEKFGSLASWALWDKASGNPKSRENVGSMEWASDEAALIKKIKTKFVFVAFNGSSQHNGKNGHEQKISWSNFHSGYKYGRDHKLRYAVLGSAAEGAYITDLIKNDKSKTAKERVNKYKENRALLEKHIDTLKREIELLCGKKKPCLIALGRDTENFLRQSLEKEGYKIFFLSHYSATTPKFDEYREQLKEILDSVG